MYNFSIFLSNIASSPFSVIAVFSALALMLINGLTDAPVSIASAVNSSALSLKKAVVLSAVFNCIGALVTGLIGNSVANSVTKIAGLSNVSSSLGAVAFTSAMLAVAIWSLISLYFGIPTSESHALLSALSGASIAVSGFDAVDFKEWAKVLVGLFLSTVPLVIITKKVTALLKARFVGKKAQLNFKKMLVLGTVMSAFAHGAQDGQKFAGVFALQMALLLGTTQSFSVPFYAVLLSAFFISAGMMIGGKKIVATLSKISSHDAVSNFSADLTSSVMLFLMSITGIPASTTSAKTSALVGTGNGQSKRSFMLFATWILTFPAGLFLGYFISKILIIIV